MLLFLPCCARDNRQESDIIINLISNKPETFNSKKKPVFGKTKEEKGKKSLKIQVQNIKYIIKMRHITTSSGQWLNIENIDLFAPTYIF